MSNPVITQREVKDQAFAMFPDYDLATTVEQHNYDKQAFALLLNDLIFNQWEAAGYTFGFLGE